MNDLVSVSKGNTKFSLIKDYEATAQFLIS